MMTRAQYAKILEMFGQEIHDRFKKHEMWVESKHEDGERGIFDGASLRGASLVRASLDGASLDGALGLIKPMGVMPGHFYWKRVDFSFSSNGYTYTVGKNNLRDGEVFAEDARVLCSCPGFHFASRSWCSQNYKERQLEMLIQIPMDAQINEPWATDGKASASSIIVVKVFDGETDVTDKFVNFADGKGNKR